MFWIEGLARTPNGFVLKTLHKDGVRTQETLAEIGTKPFKGETSRTRITTDCRTWSADSAQPFWEFLGIDRYEPRTDHEVFKVVHENTEYFVPASVVISALIRPIKHIHTDLFRPHGLEQISVPLLDGSRPSIGFFVPVHRVVGNIRTLTDGLHAALSWMHCFPSARAMWDSVYQAAQSGRLKVSLPQATITAVLHTVPWKGARLVTDMVVTKVHAEEAPFDFAIGHTSDLIFHESAAIDWALESRSKASLPNRGNLSSLSNEEWSQLAPSMKKKDATKHDLRAIIDLILLKLGTGIAWSKLDFRELNLSIVLFTYQTMQRDGRWSILEEALRLSRGKYAL
jgi:hypothetical protein